jgi:subfamily B ATP-binding cassette protein MsbA
MKLPFFSQRVVRYLKPHLKLFLGALGAMVLFGATDGIVPFLLKEILDGVFADKNKQLLALLPLLIIVFALVRAGLDYTQQYLTATVGHRVIQDLRDELHEKVLTLPPRYFLHKSPGDILARFTSDVILVRNLLTDSIAALIRDSVRIVALLIAALILDPILALGAILVFPVAIIPVTRFGKRIRRYSKQGQNAVGDVSGRLGEIVQGNKIVKIFGAEDYEQKRFKGVNSALTKVFLKSEQARALAGPVNELLASLAIAGILYYGGSTVISGTRTQGDFIAFLAAVFLLYEPFKKLSKVHGQIQQGMSGADRIFELLDEESESISKHDFINPESHSLEFDKVSFVYPGQSEAAVKNVSLEVPSGKSVALVGFSGAGKSTLVDLIPRFIEPSSGRLLLNGEDLRNYSLGNLRGLIAIVGQHTFLFHDSIFENIRYGNRDASEEDVYNAAKAAFAHEFILKLPEGYETSIGEGGFRLSGGERQRIAIARALLKDAPILILDEATASLDNRSEHEVQKALEALQQGRTSVVIAHRLSTVRHADKIVVLSDGGIVQQGTHEELLESEGEYKHLYDYQFAPKPAESDSSEGEKRISA